MPDVRGHRATLVQVIQNLLANALKFVAPGTTPAVRAWAEPRQDGRVRLWVEANGIGVPPQHAARGFNVFERLHSDAEFEGTGIGLANVRRIVERHGGRAWGESRPGEGATFSFAIPDQGTEEGGRL